jgi:hypothetical protein
MGEMLKWERGNRETIMMERGGKRRVDEEGGE